MIRMLCTLTEPTGGTALVAGHDVVAAQEEVRRGIGLVFQEQTLDLYLTGSRQSVQIFVLSPKFAEIADAITNELHRGVTVFNGKGWYTKHDTEVVMVITRKADLNVFLKCINSIDPNAFISVSSVTGVYGQGFDKFKSGNKK